MVEGWRGRRAGGPNPLQRQLAASHPNVGIDSSQCPSTRRMALAPFASQAPSQCGISICLFRIPRGIPDHQRRNPQTWEKWMPERLICSC